MGYPKLSIPGLGRNSVSVLRRMVSKDASSWKACGGVGQTFIHPDVLSGVKCVRRTDVNDVV